MKPTSAAARAGALVLLAAAFMLPARAAVVQTTFTGSVTGYWSLPILQDDFAVGTPVSLSLTYEDIFSTLSFCDLYLGMSPQVFGSLAVGSKVYSIDSMTLTSYHVGTCNEPAPFLSFRLLGSGPATDDGEAFSGAEFAVASTFLGGHIWSIAYGNLDYFVVNNGYLNVSGSSSYVRTEGPFPAPEPGTLALLGTALAGVAVGFATRRRRFVD